MSKIKCSPPFFFYITSTTATGEMAWPLIALAALVKYLGLDSSISVVDHKHVHNSRNSNTLFWPWQSPSRHMVHKNTGKTLAYIKQ